MNLERQLLELDGYAAINDIVPGKVLHPKQCIDILKCVYADKSIVSYDTGTGKTLIACGCINLLMREDRSRKFLFVMKDTQLIQTPFDIECYTELRVEEVTGSTALLRNKFSANTADHDVLCVTPNALLNPLFTDWLALYLDDYYGIVIDEAHTYSNLQHAEVANILKGIVGRLEFGVALTATPVRTDMIQLARLARIMGGKQFERYVGLKKALENGRVTLDDYPFFFINRNRSDFGEYIPPEGRLILMEPMEHQLTTLGGAQMFVQNRGEGAINQLSLLNEFIQEQADKGLRGIVYIRQHKIRDAFIKYRDDNGFTYRYDCIHGKGEAKKRSYRMNAMKNFNVKKNLDVMIMSVTESLNLDCDYVLFVELTTDVKQLTGRAHRGLGSKKLIVYFAITMTQKEIDYFYNNIYLISKEIQEILGKDYSDILGTQEQIEEYDLYG